MTFEDIASEVIEELADIYEYDNLGAVDYHQLITDITHRAFETWGIAIFVAFEEFVHAGLEARGHVPND